MERKSEITPEAELQFLFAYKGNLAFYEKTKQFVISNNKFNL